MKIKRRTIKSAITLIMTFVMMSLFAVNAFAADTIKCKRYPLDSTDFHDAVETDYPMNTRIYLTPTITTDPKSSSGYRISSVDMFFTIDPNKKTITSLSRVGFLYTVTVVYEFPNGWSGTQTYSKWVYKGDFPDGVDDKTYESPSAVINIPEYDNINYMGTRYITAKVEIYTNSTPSVSESGKFYDGFVTTEHLYMSQIVSENT